MPATFDPEAFLAEPAAPAFDPNAFLAEPAPAFDPAAFLGKSQDAAPVQPQEFDPATAYYGDFASLGNNLTADQLARAKQQLMEPLIKLPTMPDLSAMPAPQTPFINETSLTPAQAAGVYNAVKGPIEGLSSPFNLGIMGMTGGLGTAAAAGSMGAKAALVGTGVGFGALAAVDTVKLVQQAREVLADPATTEQQRTQAATAPVVSGLMGLAALAGAGRLAAGEAIPRINAAYPEVFWKKSGLNAEQFAAEYPAAVRRVAGVGGETPTPADVALVQQINAAADAAGVKLGDLARGRMVAENITWEPRAVQAIIPESLLPTQPTSSLSFRATGANGTSPARQPVAASASEPTPGTPAAAGPNALLLRDAPLAPAPVSLVPPRPVVPQTPSAPAQVAPPEPIPAPVDNAPVVAPLPAEVPAEPAAPAAAAPFDPVAFIAAPEPVQVPPEVLNLNRAEPTFTDLISGLVETPDAVLYMQERKRTSELRWANLSAPERAAAHAEFGTENQVQIQRGTFPFDVTPSRFAEVVASIESARAPVAAPAAPTPEIPLEQQLTSAELANSRASTRFREAGKWNELKGQPARQRWQALKAEKLTAERALDEIRAKVKDTAPAPAEVPVAPVESPADRDYRIQGENFDASLKKQRADADAAEAAKPPELQDPDFWVSKHVERLALERGLSIEESRQMHREGARAMILNMIKRQVDLGAPIHVNAVGERGMHKGFLKKTPKGYVREGDYYVKAPAARKAKAPPAAPAAEVPEAPAGGKVAATAAGTVITPTGTQRAKVVKLATKKQLQVQREFLEEALRNAAKVAEPNEQQLGSLPKVVIISVPGDGTFRVANDRKALLSIAEKVKKHFGKGLDWVGISTPPSEARGMASLGKKLTPEKVTKIVTGFVSTDETRLVLNEVYQDGQWTVATDGISLLFTKGGAGKTAAQFATQDIGKYPDWQALLPREGQGMKISGGKIRAGGNPVGINTADAIKKLTSAVAALANEQVIGQIHLGPNGEFGVSVIKQRNGVDYVSDGVMAGQPSVGAVDLFRLRDVLEALRRLGHVTVGLQPPETTAPTAAGETPVTKSAAFVLTGGDSAGALVMGSALKLRAAAPNIDAEIARPVNELELAREQLAEEQNALAEALERAKKVPQSVSPEQWVFIKAGIEKTQARIKDLESQPAPAPTEPSAETPAPRSGRGANASPGFAAAPPMAAPGGPPKNKPAAPADDPAFTELPIELPEAVQFFKLLTGGQYAHIRERIRALNGQAAGVFRYREGDLTSGEIELRADLFNLLSLAEKQDLLRQAVAWANAMRQGDSTLNERELIRSKFEELVRAAEQASIAAGPVRALATFWHEVGHFLDFYPQATTKRGNILGRLASLNHYFKNFLAKSPGLNAEPPTSAERAAYRRQAERELTATVSSIVETIRREEPVYREIPITADTITGVVKNLARDEFPEFYDWFAKLPRADKVSVLRQAMKGLVDERAAKFGRREATGEVKVVEETVTRVTGTPPTPEAIRARYEELLRAELESRGLINEKDIRAELEGAIAWWRGTKTVPEYFKPSVELWADTMSIFFNNPAALAKRAPKFYEAFMRWMAVKPGIREEYDKIQHAIKSGQIYRDRVTNLREMFVRDDAAGALTDEFATRTSFKQDVDVARLLFDRQFGPIERRIGRNPTDIQGQRALSALGNFRYRATGWEAFAHAMRNEVEVPLAAANLTHLDMAEYMFHRRITDGLYRNLAAPLGWNPKNSGERLAEMERDLGPARWQSLVAAQVALRGIYEKRVVTLLHEAKVMSPELAAAVDKEIFYAPFNKARVYVGGSLDAIEELIKVHHGDEAAGQIYGSVGNLGEIRSPYVQLMHRALGLISMSHRQLALKRVVDWLRVHEPLSVADSPMVWDGKRLAPVRVENSRVSTLYLLNQGKVEAVYVPRVIGEMFASGGPMEMRMIALSHTLLSPPKALLTELNPGFWPVAFAKDVWSATVSLPGGSRVLRELPRSYVGAYHTFYGKPDPLAQQVLDRMMPISRADSRGEHLGHADEMTRILLRLGNSPVQWNAEVGRIEQVLRMLWRGWAQQGQIFERTVKIASMRAVDRAFPNMPEWRKRELVRTRGGSPDFLSKGRWARVVELGLGLMFYNAWKEGARSTYRAMAENPRGFWSKFAATAGAAGAVMWALEAGLVGDDEEELRDMLRSIPERDKLRGLVLPLGWNDKAAKKVLYLVLPFPESIRWAHALQRKALQTSAGNSARKEGLGSVVNYQGQDLPGQNPWITSTSEIYDYYVKGINPYDEFTGRGALDQTRVDAEQAGGELAKRTISNVTGGIAYRYRPERPGEKFTTMEEFLKAPVVSNLLGRWLRVSNRGLDELYRQSTEKDVREQASLRLVGEEMIARTLKGEPWAQEHLALVGTSEYLANYINDAGPRLAMQADSPYLRALTQAKTNAEKLSIWKVENERNQAKVKRLDRLIGTPPPPP